MNKLIALFLFIFGTNLVLNAQNLVLNPSFEDTLCSANSDVFSPFHGSNWYSPSSGTPDCFTAGNPESGCYIQSIYSIWWEDFGEWQYPQDGQNMSGIYTYIDDFCMREFLQGKLSEPLAAGSKYCVSYWASLSNKSLRAHDRLGAYLSVDSIINFNEFCILGGPAQVQSPPGIVLADTANWMLVTHDFVAQGGERFIMIGNFTPDDQLTVVNTYVDADNPTAYYFIDNVKVELCDETIDIDQKLSPKTMFYPNPTQNQITIKPISSGDFILRSTDGKSILLASDISQLTIIDLSEVPSGYYIIELHEAGIPVRREKLLKY